MIRSSPRSNSTFPTRIRAVVEILFRGTHERLDEGKPRSLYRCCINYCICSLPLVLLGCTSLKKAGLISGASLLGGATASIVSSGTAPALLAAGTSAFATSVIVDQTLSSPTTDRGSSTLNNCAPDNFWTALGTVIEMGGIYLIVAFVVVPLLVGWMAPGPLERKKKK